MGAPVGSTGCEGSGNHADSGPRWFGGVAFGLFEADVQFPDSRDVELEQRSVTAQLGRRLGSDYSIGIAAGAILDGEIEFGERRWDIGVGWLVSVSGSRRWTFADRYFASTSLSFGVSRTTSSEQTNGAGSQRVRALDLRLGVIAGVTIGDFVSPYVLARAFAGPVSWRLDGEAITGSDKHHYQLGGGASVELAARVNALLDVSVLGERATSLALSVLF